MKALRWAVEQDLDELRLSDGHRLPALRIG